jgi:outer membrane protein insertion porin family
MYKLETVDVYDVSVWASTYVQAQKGKSTTSAISILPSIDTRDDYYNPRRGTQSSLLIQNAGGFLGGDNTFVKVLGATSWFFPLPLNMTLNLRAQVGVAVPYGSKKTVIVHPPGILTPTVEKVESLPIYEKFYVGGISTVRGFEYGMAGPKDEFDEPIGAKKMVVFNTEVIFPLSREIGLRGVVFFDVGKGFDRWKDMFPLRLGAGPGIRWFSPFGPIHIDIGFNLNPRKGEKNYVLDFTGGPVN